jgi:hypothetical protein
VKGNFQFHHYGIDGPVFQFLAGGQVELDVPGIPETVADDHGLISQFQEDGTGLLFQYPHPVNGGHATPPDFRGTGE